MEEHKERQGEEEEAGELGARSRVMTEKGLSYKMDNTLKEIESCKRAHMKLVREYEDNEQTIGDVLVIENYIRLEEESFRNYCSACNQLLSLDSTANVELSVAEESHVKIVQKMNKRISEIAEGNLFPQQKEVRSEKASSVKSSFKASSVRLAKSKSSTGFRSTH